MDAIQTADKLVQCPLSVLIGLSGLRLRFYEKWPPDVGNVTYSYSSRLFSRIKPSVLSMLYKVPIL